MPSTLLYVSIISNSSVIPHKRVFGEKRGPTDTDNNQLNRLKHLSNLHFNIQMKQIDISDTDTSVAQWTNHLIRVT